MVPLPDNLHLLRVMLDMTTAYALSLFPDGARAAKLVPLVGRICRKILRRQRAIRRLTRELARLKLKTDMLGDDRWRWRVLRDLGGALALARWRRMKAKGTPEPRPSNIPDWLREKRAEQRRWDARTHSAWAKANGYIYDPCKVDREGQFRLAPLSRGIRGARKNPTYRAAVKVETNVKLFKPIPIAPEEFLAAEAAMASRDYPRDVNTHQGFATRSLGAPPPSIRDGPLH